LNYNSIIEILTNVKKGLLSTQEAYNLLSTDQYKEMENLAVLDLKRPFRTGFPEAIYAKGKKTEHLIKIIDSLYTDKKPILITKLREDQIKAIEKINYPDINIHKGVGIATAYNVKKEDRIGKIAVVTGGTSDYNIAEETSIVAEAMGSNVIRVYDVGIAGLHRLLSRMDRLREANVIVAVAGMEGALPSVLAGLVTAPVIAVPTSVGYGASFGGISALLTMINSCAPGISVVNIDNGFGAAYQANLINIMIERKHINE
jgi:pyridinium-3,5-biscarboxylic acid mononucleotide synthase